MKVYSSFILLFIPLFFTSLFSLAQDEIEPCATEIILAKKIKENAEFKAQVERMDRQYQAVNYDKTPTVYTLPIVVHVIHEGEPIGQGSNISDEQVQSAIVALNQDFRKEPGTNGDGNGVDVEIQFCLAVRDPDGNSTTGIMRVDGSVVPNYAEQGIESTGGVGAVEEDVKALSVWPREEYINIWVVNEIEDNNASGGVQGYAYFPYNNIVDGIVVLHKAFGTVGNLKPNTDENRVVTHEMGHYFSLYHTFHQTSSCGTETNCTTQGDHICDTPPTILNASCSSPACGGTQQVENYLDYTPEVCRNMFTQGQKDRMRNCLLTQRASLLNSQGCIPATNYDAGITVINSPHGSTCNANTQPEVILTNFGAATLTSVTFTYGVDGNMNQTYNWTGSLALGTSQEVILPGFNVTSGAHVFMVETSNPNNQNDQFNGNDNLTSEFSLSPGIPIQLDITIDYYGQQTTWEIQDDQNQVVSYGGPYENMQLGTVYQELICIPSGCYTLVFYDSFGDGMGFVNGHYELHTSNDSILAQGGGNFGFIESNSFCYTQEAPTGQSPNANFSLSSAGICVGQSVAVTDASSNSPTSWSWTFEGGTPSTSTQQNPGNITFSSPGNHNITLTVSNDFGSNTTSSSLEVEANPTLTLTTQGVSCYGSNDGSILSQTTGNITNYLWSNASTQSNLTNVGQGNYTLEVSTANNCSASASATITAPNELLVLLSGQNLSCNGVSNGEITTTVTGGTGAYNYLWNNNMTTPNLSGLNAGYYVVTVTDANGCQATNDITLTQANGITSGLTTNNIACNENFGTAEVNPTGGNGNFTIQWSTGATGNSLSNLAAGDYSVTITDTGGCSITEDFTITQAEGLTTSVTSEDVTCFGQTNGQATVSVQGGQGPYTYLWSNGGQTSSISNLAANTYTVEITDEAGCQTTATVTIDQPEEITVNLLPQNVLCFGNSDGTITTNANGGAGNFSYLWNTGATSPSLNNLAAGDYQLTVTDINNCQAQASITITQPQAIQLAINGENISCFGNTDGQVSVTAQGGEGNYSYLWSNNETEPTITNLTAGLYEVIVTDQNNCQANGFYNVIQPPVLDANLTDFDIACGAGLGSAIVNPQGGDATYQIVWSTGDTGNNITNLPVGNYSVTVTDGAGCITSDNFEITTNDSLSVDVDFDDITCYGLTDAYASVMVQGGQGNYTFSWNTGYDGESLTNLSSGYYSIEVEDEAGCQGAVSFIINEPPELTLSLQGQDISCFGRNDGMATAIVEGGTGLISLEWSTGQMGEIVEGLNPGNIGVIVTDENNCTAQESIVITEPSAITVEIEVITNETCVGSDGSALATAQGGTGVLMYDWNNGSTSNLLENVSNGFYDLLVIDQNECTQSSSVYIGYDCDDIPSDSLTKLIDSDCGRSELLISDFLTCQTVEDAEMYEWKFISIERGIFYEGYTLGNNTSFELQNVPNIYYGLDMAVCIRFMKNGSWSAYGDPCNVYMKMEPPVPNMIATYCSAFEHEYNDVLIVNPLAGAAEYQWLFVSEDHEDSLIVESVINQIAITQNIGILEDVPYQVKERVKIGPHWSEFGTPCPFIVKSISSEQNIDPETNGIQIYPNPNNGENLFFDLSNLLGSDDVIDIELYNASGKKLESFEITPNVKSTKIVTHIFNTPLVPGLYYIQYTHDRTTDEMKLIVQ